MMMTTMTMMMQQQQQNWWRRWRWRVWEGRSERERLFFHSKQRWIAIRAGEDCCLCYCLLWRHTPTHLLTIVTQRYIHRTQKLTFYVANVFDSYSYSVHCGLVPSMIVWMIANPSSLPINRAIQTGRDARWRLICILIMILILMMLFEAMPSSLLD